MLRKTLLLSWLSVIFIFMPSQLHAQETFCIMELNAENFFDPLDNTEKDDDEFLPTAPRAWTWRKFWKKVDNISKLIAAAGKFAPPDVIALCEVENDTVMTCITKVGLLRKFGYEYIITNGGDVRGMNVAFIYNPQTFRVLRHESIRPDFHGLPEKKTRDIMHVTGMVLTGDTVDIFVCHLPSRLDRRKQGRDFRMRLARQVRANVDSLILVRKQANIIITGDFNETPTSEVLANGFRSENLYDNTVIAQKTRLYNLMSGKTATRGVDGTYFYKGNWEIIDHFIVSGSLLDKNSKFHTSYDACSIFSPDFLLTEQDGKYIPLRTYRGYKYSGGYSDHLPVVVRFSYSW